MISPNFSIFNDIMWPFAVHKRGTQDKVYPATSKMAKVIFPHNTAVKTTYFTG